MSQTSYNTVMGTPFAGLLDDNHPNVISSRVNSDTANISTGVFVKAGADSDKVVNLAAAADVASIVGVTLYKPGVERFGKSLGTGADYFAPKERLDIVEKGRIWMRVEEALALTDVALARVVAHGTGKLVLGALAKTADSTYTGALLPGFRVLTASSGAGLVYVEFDVSLLAAYNRAKVLNDAAYAAHA